MRDKYTLPAWTFVVPAGKAVMKVLPAYDNAFLMTPSLTVIAASNGSTRGRNSRLVDDVAAISNDSAVAADGNSGIVRFRVPSIAQAWRTQSQCFVANVPRSDAITLLSVVDGDVYVGCYGGKLIRLAAADGRVLATKVVAPVDRFTAIRLLPHGVLSVEGMASGASLRSWLTLVRRSDFAAVVQPRQDTQFVGVVGATAVLDDLCCLGRGMTYRPATIVRVDLNTGTAEPPVDLRPDAAAHPSNRLPLGIGWNAATIAHDHLLLSVTPTLYDYGDPRHLRRQPVRLITDLATLPTYFGNGVAFITRQAARGALVGALVDLTKRPIHTRKTFALQYPPVIGRDPVVAQAFSLWTSVGGAIGAEFVRVSDGAVIVPPSGCELVASTQAQAFALCSARAGAAARQYVAAFAFP